MCCPKCGRQYESGTRFCPLCGYRLPDALRATLETAVAIAVDRLKRIAQSARRFSWAGGEEYKGPIRPRGIVRISPKTKAEYWFVLCEHVSYDFLPDALWDEVSPEGIILAPLNDTFEFLHWDGKIQEIGGINGLSGPATVAELCAPPSRWAPLCEG